MNKITKGQFVTYKVRTNTIKALVQRCHKDGSYTVQAYFYVGKDGTDLPGFIGYRYRVDGDALQVAA